MKKKKGLVYGVGINDADYKVTRTSSKMVDGKRIQKVEWRCPVYVTWKDMLKRCYSDKFQTRSPTYKGCSVSEEWLTFSVFKSWMEKQNWEGKQLDKDLLLQGNKVYSPETSLFVSKMVNMFMCDSGAARGEWLIGVHWNRVRGKFQAQCSNPFTKKKDYLGHFTCELEAHKAWLKRKLELAHILAAEQTDTRVAKALIERYTNTGQ